MASRKENIIAQFIAKGTAKFKEEAHGAARAVRDVGYEGSKASEELEVLKLISSRLEKQHAALALIEGRLARQINDVGDEARQTSRDLGVLSFMSGRNAKSAGLLGKRWGFWKDRLSLTAGEVKSTALTIGGYLSPALIELASSLGSAITGAGVVGGAGLTAFIVGLSGIGIAGITAVGQLGKIKTAQDALNLSIAQYGAGSKQAAAANAKLLGVIQTQGGIQAWNAVRSINALKKAWTQKTGPARASLFEILQGGVGVGQRLLPTFAHQTNLNAATVRHGMAGVFSQLGGPEVRSNIAYFSKAFRSMFGPVTRGGTNLLFALFRLLRVATPYAVEWADSFEKWSMSVRKGSRDRAKLADFVANAVQNFKDWWGLLKAVGRLTVTVFSGSNKQGGDLVVKLTNIVNRFNAWLGVIVGPNGQTRVSKFFTDFNNSLDLLFSDPQAFGRKAAIFFAQVAKAGFVQFVKTWLAMDPSTKLFVLAYFFKRQIFATMGKLAVSVFVRNFAVGASAAFAAEGTVGAAVAGRGAVIGNIFGKAFTAAALLYIGSQLEKELINQFPVLKKYLPQKPKDAPHTARNIAKDAYNLAAKGPNTVFKKVFGRRLLPGGKAGGGTIPWGTSSIVGELGPEIASATPSGMQITPRGFQPEGTAGLRSIESMLKVSDMLPPVHVHLNVERREIGKAYVDWENDTKSRRGGRRLDH